MSDVTAVPPVQSVTAGELPEVMRAFQVTRAERDAIDDDDLVHMNVDPGLSAMMLLGALPGVAALSGELDAEFKTYRPDMLDKAKLYALSAIYAHSIHRFADTQAPVTPARIELATKRRSQYIAVYRMAAELGLVSAEPLDDLSNPNGHRNVPIDLLGIAHLIMQNWPALEGKIPLTQADVLAAFNEATELAEDLGLRGRTAKETEVTLLDKKRSFTLMCRHWEDLRGRVGWVRRKHGDADEIAPSFHVRAPRAKAAPAPVEAAPSAPVASAPAPGAPAPTESVPVGHPDASPFQK